MSWQFDKTLAVNLCCLSLVFLLLPLQWIISAVLAAMIHELGHYIAVRLLGGKIINMKVCIDGATICASGLTPQREIICLLAGPFTGLLSLLAWRLFPIVSLCSILQSAYNLLPIYPLDGGKILRNVILLAGGSKHLCKKIENTVLIILFILCVIIWLRFQVSLFLFYALLLFRKTPCKQT